TCATASPGPHGIGSYTISCSGGSDDNYKFDTAKTATLKVGYRWDGFLQPINDTAHQIGLTESLFKLGSTVPVKFQLKNAAGTIVQAATLPVFSRSAFQGACDSSTSTEGLDSDPGFAGSAFRWDSTG